MMNRMNRTWMVGVVMAAFAAVPALASAENNVPRQVSESRPAQNMSAPQEPMSMVEGPGDAGKDMTALNMDFATELSNKCVYRANVGGIIGPTEEYEKSDRRATLMPDVNIVASLECPNRTTVTVRERVQPESPITRAQLEARLEQGARIVAKDSDGRCVYAPDFALGKVFGSLGVTYMCSFEPAGASDR